MASYSAVNGVQMACNRALLTDTLRSTFGFTGWVVSDCGAVSRIASAHHYVNTTTEAAAAAINAGPSNICLYLTEKCDFNVRFLSNFSENWQG